MTSQIKLKFCISLICVLVLLTSYGCLPQEFCPPCPQHKTDTTTAAELANITKMLAYYDTLTKLSPSLSTDQLNRSKKLIRKINSEATFNSATSKKLLKLFLNIIKERQAITQERQALLAKINQLSLTNTGQQEEISKNQDALSQCETQTNTLQDQIKKLEEIEKIIIKRKETSLPN